MALKSTKGNGSIYITDYSLMAYFGANTYIYFVENESSHPLKLHIFLLIME